MAKDMKKDATDLSIEEKLKNLYQLQTMLSEIDKIKTLRGELPLEVQDLEDEIEGLSTRIEKIHGEIGERTLPRVKPISKPAKPLSKSIASSWTMCVTIVSTSL